MWRAKCRRDLFGRKSPKTLVRTRGLFFTISTTMVRMIRSVAKSSKYAHEGHKELPRFRPLRWCKTLFLHVWDCSGGDDHGELTSLGVWEWPTPSMVPWLALNYSALVLFLHISEG